MQITDSQTPFRNNGSIMSSRQQVRRAACLTLVLVLLCWAQAEAAFSSTVAHIVRCHARLQMHPAPLAAKHTMRSGCCPRHPVSKGEYAPHWNIGLPPAYPPDCCFASDQPLRPGIFLVASAITLELRMQVARRPDLPAFSPMAGLWLAESPPFTTSVFAKKTDLRI